MANKARKKEEDVDSYRHEAVTRKNDFSAGRASCDTAKHKPKKYEYDPHLDPQLVTFFLDSSARDRLKRALKATLDKDKLELLTSARSLPFKLGQEKSLWGN